MKTLKYFLILLLVLPTYIVEAQKIILNDPNLSLPPQKQTWSDFEVSKPVKQIELAVYETSKDSIIPSVFHGYLFNDDGSLSKYLTQSKYSQSAEEYFYSNGNLIGQSYGSKYGMTKDDFKLNDDDAIIGTNKYTIYRKGSDISKVLFKSKKDKEYIYKHNKEVTTITDYQAKKTWVFHQDQIIMKKSSSDYIYAYTIPYDGTEAYFKTDRFKTKFDDLIELAATDIAAYNKLVKTKLTPTQIKAPLSHSKSNEYGDWTSAIYKPQHSPSVHRYYFRKITYQDGTVSGDILVNDKYLKENARQN
ncbi:hypothetical protein LX97_00439 [Nonlabens dokdonensis]|jgi:hypothetical protein|uniref:Uncharacterized protein n=2 Tax=Nonlabens dokdonensis TaxID=328515 RepID=L7W2P0_NONDD|nr:hypothetical protein [Nonlabens dokdonensis]AGC75755.1 hypothetical protein DDD_0628 [Nonlabens dokdonensis DSW-6]PZX43439.1 hypothetical protein LX97_00439 [Nonlabens dokdonensis]